MTNGLASLARNSANTMFQILDQWSQSYVRTLRKFPCLLILVVAVFSVATAQTTASAPAAIPGGINDRALDAKVEGLLRKMTLDEKVGPTSCPASSENSCTQPREQVGAFVAGAVCVARQRVPCSS